MKIDWLNMTVALWYVVTISLILLSIYLDYV